MNELDEYQSNALRTAIYPLDRSLEYTVLGLLSEIGELAEVYATAKTAIRASLGWSTYHLSEATSETGDCYWYTAAIADAMGTTLGEIVALYEYDHGQFNSRGLTVTSLTVEAGAIASVLKKAIRDDGGTLAPDKAELIAQNLRNVIGLLDHFCELVGSSRKAVMNKNLNKLADRSTRGVLQGSGNER